MSPLPLQRVVTGVDLRLHRIGRVEQLRRLAVELQFRVHPEPLAAKVQATFADEIAEGRFVVQSGVHPQHALAVFPLEGAEQAAAVLGDDRLPVIAERQDLVGHLLRVQHSAYL